MEVVEGEVDGLEGGEIPEAQGYAVTRKVMREDDVADGTGAPETPGAGTGGQEGIEIVPVSKEEEPGEKPRLPESAHGISMHVVPGARFE